MAEDTQAILTHLKEQGQRLGGIETAIRQIAVQNNQIENLQAQVVSMHSKHDTLLGPRGALTQLSVFQAGCPRHQMPRVWWAIGLCATLSLTSTGLAITIASRILI